MPRIATNLYAEQCTCGHARGMHTDRWAPGHGACKMGSCPCGQFTWAAEPKGGYKFVEADHA